MIRLLKRGPRYARPAGFPAPLAKKGRKHNELRPKTWTAK